MSEDYIFISGVVLIVLLYGLLSYRYITKSLFVQIGIIVCLGCICILYRNHKAKGLSASPQTSPGVVSTNLNPSSSEPVDSSVFYY